jgi:type II secretory pathway component PulK
MTRGRRPTSRRRGGFALPMVFLLALVVGITAAVMLERETVQHLSSERVLASYREHHMGRGVREVVSAWLVTLTGQPLEKMIAEDGRVLDIRRPDGGTVRVYFEDGQGSALTDLTAAGGEDLAIGRAIRERLRELGGGRPHPSWVRTVGPVRISAATAASEVLEAAAFAVTKKKEVSRAFAREVVRARDEGQLTVERIGVAAQRAGLSGEERTQIDRVLAARPDLWLVRVEVLTPERAGSASRVVGRFRGRVLLGGPGASGIGTGMMQSMGSFLSWEEERIDERGRGRRE